MFIYSNNNNNNSQGTQAKRQLTLEWSGNAVNTLRLPKYSKLCGHVWNVTGCGLTVDGSADAVIKPQGMPNYECPPP